MTVLYKSLAQLGLMLLPLEQAGKQAAGTAQARASLERYSKR